MLYASDFRDEQIVMIGEENKLLDISDYFGKVADKIHEQSNSIGFPDYNMQVIPNKSVEEDMTVISLDYWCKGVYRPIFEWSVERRGSWVERDDKYMILFKDRILNKETEEVCIGYHLGKYVEKCEVATREMMKLIIDSLSGRNLGGRVDVVRA